MDDGRKRGAKPLAPRDWLFGSRPRRLLIDDVLSAPGSIWSKTDLAAKAEVVRHGGVDEHVAGFARLGLLVPTADGRWSVPSPATPLAKSLRRVSDALIESSSEPVAGRPPRARQTEAHPALPALRQAITMARRDRNEMDDSSRQAVVDLLQAAEQLLAEPPGPDDRRR